MFYDTSLVFLLPFFILYPTVFFPSLNSNFSTSSGRYLDKSIYIMRINLHWGYTDYMTNGQPININSTTSCLTFSSRQWIKSHNLLYTRVYSLSWLSKEGVVLMGSGHSGSANTTEILTNDGNSRPSFPLKANIMYDDTYL